MLLEICDVFCLFVLFVVLVVPVKCRLSPCWVRCSHCDVKGHQHYDKVIKCQHSRYVFPHPNV